MINEFKVKRDRWDFFCDELESLNDFEQTNIFWCLLGHLKVLNNDRTFEILNSLVEKKTVKRKENKRVSL